MPRKIGLMVVLSVCAGCMQPPRQELSPLQQRQVFSRNVANECDASYNDVWWGALTVLQDNGFVLRQANHDSGYLYGVQSRSVERNPLEISVTLERAGEKNTRVRIGVCDERSRDTANDAAVASRFFIAIRKEVFLRAASRRMGVDGVPAAVSEKGVAPAGVPEKKDK